MMIFVVHLEFVPTGSAVNSNFYCNALRHLREDVRLKKGQTFGADINGYSIITAPLLMHPLERHNFLTKDSMMIIPHPPYSPDLAPATWHCFQKWNWSQRARLRHFRKKHRMRQSTAIKKRTFWKKRCSRCIRSKDDYFEDNGDLI